MRVISTLLPALREELTGHRPTVLMAFDTLVDKKSVVVGLTEGVVTGPDVSDTRLSDVGQMVLARCSSHHRVNYPQGAVVLAGVASVSGAIQRVRKVLTQAPEHALVLFVCANGKVYDAAFDALGFDPQTAHQQGDH